MLTNRFGLPEELARSIASWTDRKSPQDPDYYRVTELLKPAQLVVLERRHKDKLDVDVSDLVNAFKGTAIHELISKYDQHDAIQEASLEITIQGREIHGKPDYYSGDGTLADFKSCKVWKYIYQDFVDWTEQVNIYKLMLEAIGFPVKRQGVVAIFDDWTRAKAKTDAQYPPAVAMWIPIIRMDNKDIEKMLQDKITKLDRARKCADEKLPPCSAVDMWEDPTIYKVKKQGAKTAFRNFPGDKTAAEKLAAQMVKEKGVYYAVEEHPGIRKRCEYYCPVSSVCIQNRLYQESKREEVTEDGTVQEEARGSGSLPLDG